MSARDLFAEMGVSLPERGGLNVRVRCFANPEAHAHGDKNPSLSVNTESGAYLCFTCGAKGGVYDAALALGKTPAEAMALLERHGLRREDEGAGTVAAPRQATRHREDSPPELHESAQPVLRTTEEQIREWHDALISKPAALERLFELRGWTREAVEILGLGFDGQRVIFPVRDGDGALVGVLRYAPNPESRNGSKLLADLGSRRDLFPAPESVDDDAFLLLVEGEPDAVSGTSVGLPTVGIPGAQGWKSPWAERFAGRRVAVALDCDRQGREAAAKVVDDLYDHVEEVRLVDLVPTRDDGYDLGDALRGVKTGAEREQARKWIQNVIGSTEPYERALRPEEPESRKTPAEPASTAEEEVRQGNRTPTGKPPDLAFEPDILARFVTDLRLAGVAGEERLARVTFLALVSRLLPWGKATNRPVSVLAKGSSSTGKSHTTQTVLRFFPSSAYLDYGSMSKRYLLYADEDLRHRFLVIPEAAAILNDDELITSLRTLLSEGRLSHGTVDGDGKRTARRIEKDGPTGLLMTTTKASLDDELETRCLSIVTDDTPAQTRRVFETLAELEEDAECPVDFEPWHALQAWLEEGETRVVIPFARALARLFPDGSPRLRRDFVSLLCLVRAHAILHRAGRERDESERIVATLEDYTAVRSLVGDLVAEGADAAVSAGVRETVEAVHELEEEGTAEYISVKALTDKLGIGKSATYDRVKRALFQGYLVNKTKENERGLKLASGAPMPGAADFLPSATAVHELFRSLSGTPTGNEKAHESKKSRPVSGFPALPATPETEGAGP